MISTISQNSSSNVSENHKIALIFDLDGTLLDSINLVSIYFYNEFPKRFNVSWDETIAKEIESYVLGMIQGKSSPILILKALNWISDYFHFGFFTKLRFNKELGNYYKENISKVPLFEGAYDAVKNLSLLPNILTCMNTSSSKKEVAQRFKGREKLLDMFSGPFITRDKVKNLKPNPDSILLIHKSTKIPLSNMIMIGDMEIDIMAGKNTGIYTIGVTCGHLKEKEFEALNVDLIFRDVKELADNIDKILEYISNNPPKPMPSNIPRNN